jgi:hypothetical protein
MEPEHWPELTYSGWKKTLHTLHLWTQVIGKIRLKAMPWTNHSWHVSFYVSPCGLTTGSMPFSGGIFEIEFDFIKHQLRISTSDARLEVIRLFPKSVADFYKEVFEALDLLGVDMEIYPVPNELDHATPFPEDREHNSYDLKKVSDFWRILVSTYKVFLDFRARFIGKSSPVHFFWGGFDLALTRFSGREAPLHPGGIPNMPIPVMQEAYSHEVSSAGFWPGNDAFPEPIFYSYCYPVLAEFRDQPVSPQEAYFHAELGEFVLPYERLRQAEDPDQMLLDFLQTTYEAAAMAGHWDREALERDFSHLY